MEVRHKLYLTMMQKRVQRQLWYYDVSLVSEVLSKAHYSSNTVNIRFTLTNVYVETSDVSEHLDFCFYVKFVFKDNAGISPSETVSWLVISHHTGSLMCFIY